VLSLYGQLAAAMTPGTFVAGEASTLSRWPKRITVRPTSRRTA
jgi:hypothetical protein